MVKLFRNKFLKLIRWEYPLENSIWRIFPQHKLYLILEIRDIEKKKTFYNCIDSDTGKEIWTALEFTEKWWVGLEGIFDEYAIYHFFARPDLPQHKKVICVDIKSGIILWENPDYVFSAFDGTSLVCRQSDFEKSSNYKINIRSGEVIEEIEQVLAGNFNRFNYQSNFIVPALISSDGNLSVKNFFQNNIKLYDDNSTVEYLYINKKNILGFSQNVSQDQLKNSLTDYIFITDEEGKILFKDIINTGGYISITPKYFVKNNSLFFIRNKNKLISIDLS